jgi:hypothetical protein
MPFAVGSLVKARGREWVVLPESTDDLLVLRPLGGTDAEVAGVYLPLEHVEPARFDLPDPARVGDYRSARLLRDAVRLGFRSSAGPFRSFARLAFEPRPYQLVPLLMALKLDPGPESCSTAARSSGWPCSAHLSWPSSGRPSCATSSTLKPN